MEISSEGNSFAEVEALFQRMEKKLEEMLYIVFNQKRYSAVNKMFIWKKGNQAAAQWVHADSMYQNNLKVLVCLSKDGCSATRIMPYE